MIRRLLFSCCVAAAFSLAHADDKPPAELPVQPSPPVDFTKLSWKDGESLTYVVSCYKLLAAQGTFTAHNKGDHWEYDLDLKSLAWVDTFYPFIGEFWSIMGPGQSWRSVEYGEYRFEPKRTVKERTRIDYTAHLGTREDWARNKTTTYPVAEEAIDDVGSMLYHLRSGDWKVGDRRTIFVYESDSEKQANATCEAIESKAFGTYPAQSCIRLTVIPGKGTHRKGHLTLWMTNDAKRLPLHAEMEFKYGTFDMDLTKTDKVATP